jgi:hypothetical protein
MFYFASNFFNLRTAVTKHTLRSLNATCCNFLGTCSNPLFQLTVQNESKAKRQSVIYWHSHKQRFRNQTFLMKATVIYICTWHGQIGLCFQTA